MLDEVCDVAATPVGNLTDNLEVEVANTYQTSAVSASPAHCTDRMHTFNVVQRILDDQEFTCIAVSIRIEALSARTLIKSIPSLSLSTLWECSQNVEASLNQITR